MLVIIFKAKGADGKWSSVPLQDDVGLTIDQVIRKYDGTDCVMECSRDGQIVGYVCGTPEWIAYYKAKGFEKVYSIPEFLLWKKEAMQATILSPAELTVFGPGCELEELRLF